MDARARYALAGALTIAVSVSVMTAVTLTNGVALADEEGSVIGEKSVVVAPPRVAPSETADAAAPDGAAAATNPSPAPAPQETAIDAPEDAEPSASQDVARETDVLRVPAPDPGIVPPRTPTDENSSSPADPPGAEQRRDRQSERRGPAESTASLAVAESERRDDRSAQKDAERGERAAAPSAQRADAAREGRGNGARDQSRGSPD